MKKIILVWLFLLPIIFQGINLQAQVPKLNNAFYFSSGIVIDSKGNAFVTGKNKKIIKINPNGKAELFAGGGKYNKDGIGINAGFSDLSGIAIDSMDNMYVADNTVIRRISADGMVSTPVGTARAESKDGDRTTASFLHLENITIDNNGNIYVTDYAPGKDWTPGKAPHTGHYLIRKISPQFIVTTLQNGNTGPLILDNPGGLACDKDGNLYICINKSHCIKKINPEGVITTIAGKCNESISTSVYKEGTTNVAVLTTPGGITIAKNGDIYFSDERLNRIIKISNNKVITVAGGAKMNYNGYADCAVPGDTDGKALQATFDFPTAIAFDKEGNLYIVDGNSTNNSYIRKLTPGGMVSTFCKHKWNPKTQQFEEAD